MDTQHGCTKGKDNHFGRPKMAALNFEVWSNSQEVAAIAGMNPANRHQDALEDVTPHPRLRELLTNLMGAERATCHKDANQFSWTTFMTCWDNCLCYRFSLVVCIGLYWCTYNYSIAKCKHIIMYDSYMIFLLIFFSEHIFCLAHGWFLNQALQQKQAQLDHAQRAFSAELEQFMEG